MPRIAANSSVTHSTPAASSPSRRSRSSPKWKITKVVTANSAIAGTDSLVRSSTSRSLRAIADAPLSRRASVDRRAASAASTSARGRVQRPRARRAGPAPGRPRASARSTSWLTSTRVRRRSAADQRLDQRGGLRVEVRLRLVEQQQLGRVQHRPADRQPLRPCRARGCGAARPPGAACRSASSSSAIRALRARGPRTGGRRRRGSRAP